MNLSIDQIVAAVSGLLLTGWGGESPGGFSIDTRTLRAGDFFVPLTGDNVDGHEYIPGAFQKGAMGTFVAASRRGSFRPREGRAAVLVEDCLQALQDTAAYYRKGFSLPVVAITGSAGKTTTKDYTAAVLEEGYSVLKTEGNLNNEIGLPLMLLRLRGHHEAAVLEMGMSGFGEIAALTRLARPRIGVITNIGQAHLEMVGSLEGVARAKGELLQEMPPGGIAVLNGEDPRLVHMGQHFSGETIYYGFREDYPVRGEHLVSEGGRMSFKLHLFGREIPVVLPQGGRHTVLNALAAAAVGHILGLAPTRIKRGLERARVTGGRLQVEKRAGMTLLNDTYNSNPTSVRASLEVLVELAGGGVKGAVLGDMLELGEEGPSIHEEMGRHAARVGLDYLITLGELSFHTARGAKREGLKRVEQCMEGEGAVKALRSLASPGDFILIKGSRGMRMEEIVAGIGEDFFHQEDQV